MRRRCIFGLIYGIATLILVGTYFFGLQFKKSQVRVLVKKGAVEILIIGSTIDAIDPSPYFGYWFGGIQSPLLIPRFIRQQYGSTSVLIPLWPVIVAFAVLAILNLRMQSRNIYFLCSRCGYNLTGNVSGKCSECGLDIAVSRDEKMQELKTSP